MKIKSDMILENKVKAVFSLVLFFIFLSFKEALAVCPVCTVAVGAGVGFSRWLGIDDSVTGLWVGGLIVSLIAWTDNWLEARKIYFKGRLWVGVLGYYALVIIPLYYSGIIGSPLNTLCFCGLDKLLFGIIAGSVIFLVMTIWYGCLKKRNNDRAYFPFQKVAMPVAGLILFSVLFYFFIK